MRGWMVVAAMILSLGVALPGAAAATGHRSIADRRVAKDGVTKGWLVEYPWPDQTEESEKGRKIAGTLVVARHGRVVRRFEGDSTFWGWAFRDGGREVAYETGPLHGETVCVLREVRSGRVVERVAGDCRNVEENAPAWVRSVKAR